MFSLDRKGLRMSYLNIGCPMNYLPKKAKNSRGQTLLSLLLALAVFAILAHAIFTLTTASFSLVGFSKARITARHLAQEKIELIRNMTYDDVGTLGGIPAGSLVRTENVVRNGLNLAVRIGIIYVDDVFDGVSPDDTLPTDYKRVRVEVSWEGLAKSGKNPVILVTDISPQGVETTAGGGTLSILVFDANAIPIPQASVHVLASSLNPVVDLTLETNDNGRIVLPGTPTCITCYQITASKEGFSSERTYSTAEVTNPNKPHVSIIESESTEVSFAIDILSNIDIASVNDRENNFVALGNISFNLRGQKTIGTDVNDLPVYKYEEQLETDDTGILELNDLEWDNYEVTLSVTSSYDIAGINPLIPLSVLPNSNYDLSFALAAHTDHSLLLTITNLEEIPIASASAILSDGVDFEEQKLTGRKDNPDFGQVFYSALSELTYDLVATASGYFDFTGNVIVSRYTQDLINLNPE